MRIDMRGRVQSSATGVAVAAAFVLLFWAPLTSPLGAQIVLEDPDRNMTMRISGRVQPRYEYSGLHDSEDRSSVYLRRVRLDVQGQIFSDRLTYRIMPELARTANLRDAWMNYEFSPRAQVRAGQFTVPFQWHRFVSSSRQHFPERGEPSETFGFPNGRDIGLMLHGQTADRRIGYAAGVFDGAGRNVQFSNSTGHMASARVGVAALGTLPREEGDFRRAHHSPNVAFGVGVQAANRNEARTWDLGRSPAGNHRGDWITGTVDAHLLYRGLSVATDAYLRRVIPDDPAVDDYRGVGFMVTGGFALLPDRLDLVGRFSELFLDRDVTETRENEWGAGINVYHRGHDSKIRVTYLARRTFRGAVGAGDFGTDGRFIVEYHVQF